MGGSPFRNTNSNATAHPACSLQLTSNLAAHNHQCTRFCSFKYLFGNVWLCTSSGKHHVCDRTCDQRIFWGEFNRVRWFSMVLRPGDSIADTTAGTCRKSPHHLQAEQDCDPEYAKLASLSATWQVSLPECGVK